MNTVGPAMSLRTSCCDLPQKLQYSVLLVSDPESLVIPVSQTPLREGRVRLSYYPEGINQPDTQIANNP
jgi:hypothetical protein